MVRDLLEKDLEELRAELQREVRKLKFDQRLLLYGTRSALMSHTRSLHPSQEKPVPVTIRAPRLQRLDGDHPEA